MRPSFLHALLPFGLFALVACKGADRPGSITGDGAVAPPPPDRPLSELPPLVDRTDPVDGPDGPPSEVGADAPVPDTGAPTDLGRDAGSDAAPMDTPPAVNRLCSFRPEQLNAIAVRLATCLGQPVQPLLEAMYRPEWWESGPIPLRACEALATCAATVRSCPDLFNDCLKYRVTPVDGGSCASLRPSCELDRQATRCEGSNIISDDCEGVSRRCVATTTEAVCVPMRADPCAPGAPPRCNGDSYEQCLAGVYVPVRDCGRALARCDVAVGGCVGTGGACSGEAVTCDGTRVSRCRGGRASVVDCALLVTGGACRTVGSRSFCGGGTECDPSAAPATGRCEGDTLVVCAGGSTLRFDCRGAGFSRCGGNGCVP
ncbi:MAG: hypothetical protein HY909_02835 [Deltaproteobacteria bacterium]|nr:hypothetical protein [Deltaproteobacteria bacterium]